MHDYSLSHVADAVLLIDLHALVGNERATTASLLAHIAEVDERRLYRPAAYPSMYDYCVGELHLSEDAASKRIHAARAARKFPAIFPALADGRLHLSAVVLLAPRLTPDTADELLAAATHKTKAEIEQLLAERFPRQDVPAQIMPLAPPRLADQPDVAGTTDSTDSHAPGHVNVAAPRPKVAPLSPGRFALQVTLDQQAHDDLAYAQALLAHAEPSGDLAKVIGRALRALVSQLEKGKFAATSRSRPASRRRSADPRHIPAAVRREVWQRDGGQCTFVSEQGRRCASHKFLELDHVDPVARGGQASVEGVRLRCRAHNQYAAEQVYGAGFMERKREEARSRAAAKCAAREEAAERKAAAARKAAEAREAAAERKAAAARKAAEAREAAAERKAAAARKAAEAREEAAERKAAAARKAAEAREEAAERKAAAARKAAEAREAEQDRSRSVVPYLMELGFKLREARAAYERCEALPEDTTLEDRIKFALRSLAPRSARRALHVA